jgi:hypothetical protein
VRLASVSWSSPFEGSLFFEETSLLTLAACCIANFLLVVVNCRCTRTLCVWLGKPTEQLLASSHVVCVVPSPN